MKKLLVLSSLCLVSVLAAVNYPLKENQTTEIAVGSTAEVTFNEDAGWAVVDSSVPAWINMFEIESDGSRTFTFDAAKSGTAQLKFEQLEGAATTKTFGVKFVG